MMSTSSANSSSFVRTAMATVGGVVLVAAAVVALGWVLLQLAVRRDAHTKARPRADNVVVLTAPYALIRGEALVVPRRDASYVDVWSRVEDEIEWRFAIPRAGDYEIFVEYACSNDNAGSVLTVTLDDGSFEHVTRGSANPGAWKSDRIASVKFDEAGLKTLSIRAVRIPGESVMKLKQVRLRLVSE